EAVGDETLPTRPASPYGVTKLAAEHLVLAHVDMFGFPAVILRYFSLFGPRQRPDMAYHRFIEAMLDGRPITIYGDGRQTRANTFVSDAVEATIAALDRGMIGEVYNIGGGESISVRGAVDILADLLEVEPTIDFAAPAPGDQRHTAADISKARAALAFQPTVGPRAGLLAQVRWHRGRRAS